MAESTDIHMSVSAAWNFWIVGTALVVIALSEIARFTRWKEWLVAAIGTWLVISPLILEFARLNFSTWNAVLSGLLTIALAGWAIGDAHEIFPRLVRPKGDLRGSMQGGSVPDEHSHYAGVHEHHPSSGPDIVSPEVGGGATGQTTKGG